MQGHVDWALDEIVLFAGVGSFMRLPIELRIYCFFHLINEINLSLPESFPVRFIWAVIEEAPTPWRVWTIDTPTPTIRERIKRNEVRKYIFGTQDEWRIKRPHRVETIRLTLR